MDEVLNIGDGLLREKLIQMRATLTMRFRCDARENGAVQVKLGYLDRVFLSTASTGSVDLFVVIWVIDVDFIGVDANDGA